MRNSIKALAVVPALVAGLAAAPALYAHESGESGGSMMGPGMMGQGGMMGQMSEMMETCNKMMQSMTQPGSDEQRHEDAPKGSPAPDKNG